MENVVLKSAHGSSVKVKRVTKLPERQDVYNMEVENIHNFAVQGGVIVHNCYDSARYFLMERPISAAEEKIIVPKIYSPF